MASGLVGWSGRGENQKASVGVVEGKEEFRVRSLVTLAADFFFIKDSVFMSLLTVSRNVGRSEVRVQMVVSRKTGFDEEKLV